MIREKDVRATRSTSHCNTVDRENLPQIKGYLLVHEREDSHLPISLNLSFEKTAFDMLFGQLQHIGFAARSISDHGRYLWTEQSNHSANPSIERSNYG